MTEAIETGLAKDLADIRGMMHDKGVMFCFSGYMTESILSGLSGAVRQKLEVEDADRKTVRGLFSIFVELVQNVIRYSAEKNVRPDPEKMIDLRYGVITVGKGPNGYFVSCGNLIENKDVSRLSTGLSEIVNLDRDELHKLYKMTLKGPTPATSKGAGVGFIEIARRTDDGFEFDFRQIDENHSFFAVRANM